MTTFNEHIVDAAGNDVNLSLYRAAVAIKPESDVQYISGHMYYYWMGDDGWYVYPNDFHLAADVWGKIKPLGYQMTYRNQRITLVAEYAQFSLAEFYQMQELERVGLRIETMPAHKYLVHDYLIPRDF